MKKTIILTIAVISLQMSAMGQLVSLSRGGGGPLWVDLDRIYNYNLYEKSRWGLGLHYGYQLRELNADSPWYRRFSAGAYFGYGYADQRWKWGADMAYWTHLEKQGKFYLSFFHDLTPAASRLVTQQSSLILHHSQLPASFMTRLFNDTYRATVGYSQKLSNKVSGSFQLDLSSECELFGNGSPHEKALIYPTPSELGDLKSYDYVELNFHLAHTDGFSALVSAGLVYNGVQRPNPILRALLQYDRLFTFSFLDFDLFAQSGFVESRSKTPYSRLFDLGGTWGSPLVLSRALLTARPNEFTAKLFAIACMKLSTTNPLFTLYSDLFAIGTSPRPFLLCNAAWGASFSDFYPAPDEGIAEVGAGIDGIVRWGAVDWGLAVAYRLTPSSASYHLTAPKDNLVVLLTATLRY